MPGLLFFRMLGFEICSWKLALTPTPLPFTGEGLG